VAEQTKGLPFGSGVVVQLVVRGSRVGNVIALYRSVRPLQSEDTPVVSETGSLIAAELELAEIEAQNQRLALAELRAPRPQISRYFTHEALAAVAALIRNNPDEARELVGEFAQFIRYAFRGEQPYVTFADSFVTSSSIGGRNRGDSAIASRSEVARNQQYSVRWSRYCRSSRSSRRGATTRRRDNERDRSHRDPWCGPEQRWRDMSPR
jgi:hypothetical protein